MSDEAKFLDALPVIDDVTGQVCRRHRLSPSESDEFRSDVRLHFIERNYEVLRKFEGRCALSTYVNVVTQRVYLDWRNRNWGRWRPSTEAKRLGPTAILIERLVTRDGWTLEQAIETLRTNHQVELDKAHTAFCNTLSARAQRRMVSEDEVVDLPSPAPPADDNIVKAERDFLAKRVLAALDRARQGLPPMDRLILKMRFDDGVAVSDIARTLDLEQRPLYRTIDDLKKTIREAMLADGISRADIEALLGAEPVEWEKNADRGPQASTHTTGRQDRKGASWLRNR